MSHLDGWKFEWLTSWAEIWDPAFISRWQGLMEQDPNAHVFFSPCVVRAWCDAILPVQSVRPCFLVASNECGTTILFPLVTRGSDWRNGWLRFLEPVGSGSFDYLDPIVARSGSPVISDEFWASFFAACNRTFRREIDLIRVPSIRETSLPKDHEGTPVTRAPFVALAGYPDFDGFLSTLSKKWRHDVRYQRRRLADCGKLEMKVCGLDDDVTASEILESLLKFHSVRWSYSHKERTKQQRMTLWKCLLDHGLPNGTAHVSALVCDAKIVSCCLGFRYRRTYYLYNTAYSHIMESFSPGKVHVSMLIESAMRDGIEVFDFLRGNESYKLHWTKDFEALYCMERPVSTISLFVRSRIHNACNYLRDALKRQPVAVTKDSGAEDT
jgi:CelD/BcsL family acetyltransferase involved in cellulose biosynthesis